VGKDVTTRGYRALLVLSLAALSLPIAAAGSGLDEASVAVVFRDVNLVAPNVPSRPASPNDNVREGTAVATGADSRVELTFNNQAVARLGANAGLSLKARNVLELTRGAVLIEIPGGSKGKIQAAGVAVGISAATAVLEYQPPAFKFLVLQGTGRLYRPRHLGDSVLVRAGQMVFGVATAALTDPVDFEIGRFVKTCPLIQEFSPLRSEKLIAIENQGQERARSKNRLIDTNLVIFGGGSTVSIVDPAKTIPASNPAADSATGPPNPPPTSRSTQTLAEIRP
jgi:FecR protein